MIIGLNPYHIVVASSAFMRARSALYSEIQVDLGFSHTNPHSYATTKPTFQNPYPQQPPESHTYENRVTPIASI